MRGTVASFGPGFHVYNPNLLDWTSQRCALGRVAMILQQAPWRNLRDYAAYRVYPSIVDRGRNSSNNLAKLTFGFRLCGNC